MQVQAIVRGFFSDFTNNDLFQKEMIQVNYSADPIGKTLSLASSKHNVQITVPFEVVEQLIRRTET